MKALERLVVLDLARVLAGPYACQLLADFGATVIKVEEPRGEELRSWHPQTPEGESTNFQSVNRGKRAITLNLKAPEARGMLKQLVQRADVVLHSYLPEVALKLGLDYATVQSWNPDVIYCSISGYGEVGPLANKPGYDLMVQAFLGVMTMTGEPGRGPMRAGFSAIDLSTGMLAYSGIVTALLARANGKARGQHVRVSLLESGMALLGYHVTNYLNADYAPRQAGSGLGHIVPYQAFKCLDGFLLAGAPNDGLFAKFCAAMDLPALASDERFATPTRRTENRDTLVAILSDRFATKSVREWNDAFEAAGVPSSPVHTIDQILSHPQILATEMVTETEGARGRRVAMVGTPIKLSETPGRMGARPPEIGEHNGEVYGEFLGLSADDIAELRTRGVV